MMQRDPQQFNTTFDLAGVQLGPDIDPRNLAADPYVIHSSDSKVHAELKLLLEVADPRSSEPERSASLPQDGVDWDCLVDMAEWHGLIPRMYAFLRRQADRVPSAIMDRLRQGANATAVLNLHLAGQLIALSSRLRAERIPHVVYKGPLLASMLYDNLALRTSNDLDIVVPKEQLQQALDVLLAIGFCDKNRLSEAQQAAAFRFGCEHSFVSSETGTLVDLHWRIVPSFVSPSLDMTAIWKRVIDVPLFDHALPTFCPEDLLFVLCLHAGQHDWAHVGLFTDIVQVLRRRNLDWAAVERHLEDGNTRRIVNVSLLLARSWKIELPERMIAAIEADQQSRHIAGKVRSKFWASRRNPLPIDTDLSWLAERTKEEPLSDRLRWIAGFLFNPTLVDYISFDLPSSLIPLYPALRFFRILLKRTGLLRARPDT